ncbi:MAG: alpha/beta hydrolase [Eubacteriales bacterium]
MKKALKITGIILGAIILIVIALLIYMSKKPNVPNDYTDTVETGGRLEAKYISTGSHEVSYFENGAMSSFEKYEIFYPSDITVSDKKYPVVIFVNGTGVKGSKYQALQKHLASWGFITVATEEEYAWNGFSAEMSLRFLQKLNSEKVEIKGYGNELYGKVDLENVGITGHSQGGVGVFNAATEQKNGSNYKAIVSLSPTNHELADALDWVYDECNVKVPTLVMSSTGNTDENLVVNLNGLTEIYNRIADSTTKIMARRNDADHGDMLYFADGYVTAWFMYWLQGDEAAGEAFFGDDPEIMKNELYQDQIGNLQE